MANEFRFTIRADDRSKPATDQAQRNMRDVGQTAQRVGQALKTAFTITAIVAVGRQLIKISGDLQKTYAVQERAERKLAQAVASSPLVDGTATRRLQEFASELQGITTLGDEVTIDLAAMAVTWGRNETEVRQLIRASADLSEALGLDVTTAMRGVNNLMEGNITTLSRYIPELRNLTAEQIEAGEAMELLEQRFGGMAEAMRDTTEGSMKAFANAWGDLQEQLGRRAAERMTPIRNFFTGLIEDLTAALTASNDLRDAMREVTALSAGADITTLDTDALYQGLRQQARGLTERILRLEDTLDRPDAQLEQMLLSRSDLEANRAALVNDLAEILKQLDATEREEHRREVVDLERSEQARAAEALSQGQQHFIEVRDALTGQLAINQRMFNLWGDQYDLEEANNKAVVGALDELVKLGYDVGGANIDTIMDVFGHHLIEPAEETAKAFKAVIDPIAIVSGMIDDMQEALDENTSSLSSSAIQMSMSFGNLNKHVDTVAGLMKGELIPVLESLPDMDLGPGQTGLSALTGTISQQASADAPGAGLLGAIAGPLGMLAELLLDLAMKIQAVATLSAPLKVILDGILSVLGPVVNAGLAPLIGILSYLGQIIGHFLVPIFEVLIPIIELLGKVFIWLYNNVFVNVYNAFRVFGNRVYNVFAQMVNWVIGLLNRLPGVNIAGVALRGPGHGTLGTIDMEDLTSAGMGAMGAGTGGTAAQYTTGRNVTVNVEIFTDVIAGEGGIRDLALIIRDEIRSAEALGA